MLLYENIPHLLCVGHIIQPWHVLFLYNRTVFCASLFLTYLFLIVTKSPERMHLLQNNAVIIQINHISQMSYNSHTLLHITTLFAHNLQFTCSTIGLAIIKLTQKTKTAFLSNQSSVVWCVPDYGWSLTGVHQSSVKCFDSVVYDYVC